MNYAEENLTGVKYTRTNGIRIDNPRVGEKRITFTEEDVFEADGKTIAQMRPISLVKVVDDLSETFPILDKTTGEVVKTVTVQEAYDIMFSYYFYVAKERDIVESSNN